MRTSQQQYWLEKAASGGVPKTLCELAELQQKQGELELARASYAKVPNKDTLPHRTPTVKCYAWDKVVKRITHRHSNSIA